MGKGRPREFDAEKALDAAMRLFWRQGYEGTSIAALAKAMRINPPSLYAAFGNKERLFGQVLERYLQNPASYLPKALHAPTTRRAIEKLFQGAIDMAMNPENPDGCMLVQGALATGPTAKAARKQLSRGRAAAEAEVRRRFELAIAKSDLPKATEPAKLARYVMTVVWGMSVQAAGGATRRQLEEIAASAMRVCRQ
jgi:AcrR family transcriptional regulator